MKRKDIWMNTSGHTMLYRIKIFFVLEKGPCNHKIFRFFELIFL